MRTTLSLDDDVAQLLNKEVRRSGGSFKEVVNRFLRMGLMASKRPARKPFVVKPWDLMPPAGLSFDNVEDLLDTLEGPERR
ncbi:MAG TPA: hypothetical protein VKI40_04975 [Terriglobales bacterium]|nr:hypothetical protein [Terriglobales bacterium]